MIIGFSAFEKRFSFFHLFTITDIDDFTFGDRFHPFKDLPHHLVNDTVKNMRCVASLPVMLDALNAQYDDIISWADMYDSASMESKKMIVSCLIRRVEVYRDYRLHIDFNIDFEQFSAGLDISAIAA